MRYDPRTDPRPAHLTRGEVYALLELLRVGACALRYAEGVPDPDP